MAKRNVLRMNNIESNRLTKECLTTALIYLMGEKPFEKISITELVKKSGVSRTAFYRNYSTKEDILHDVAAVMKKTIADQLSLPEYKTDRKKWYLNCFQLVAQHEKTIHMLRRAGLSINFLFSDESDSVIDDLISSTTWQGHYCKLAAEAAFFRTLLAWFDSGMKESPEDMATLCALVHDKIMS